MIKNLKKALVLCLTAILVVAHSIPVFAADKKSDSQMISIDA